MSLSALVFLGTSATCGVSGAEVGEQIGFDVTTEALSFDFIFDLTLTISHRRPSAIGPNDLTHCELAVNGS